MTGSDQERVRFVLYQDGWEGARLRQKWGWGEWREGKGGQRGVRG